MRPKLLLQTLVTASLLTCSAVYCQLPNTIFEDITYEDGYDPDWTYAIRQDHTGFIWIGTGGMLLRYDGIEFVEFFKETSFSLIQEIQVDRKGRLWIATRSYGVFIADIVREEIINYRNDSVSDVTEVYQDSEGVIWCATREGLLKLEPSLREQWGKINEMYDISFFIIDPAKERNVVTDLHEDLEGRLWISGSNGFGLFDKETGKYTRLDDDKNNKTRFLNDIVFSFIEENQDVFWVNTRGGFSRISNISKALGDANIDKSDLVIENYEYGQLIAGAGISKFYRDSRNNIWFGSRRKGLIRIETDTRGQAVFNEVYPDISEPGGSQFDVVTEIREDRTGLMWTGHEKRGIRKFRPGNNPFTSFKEKLYDYQVNRYDFNNIYEDEDDKLWVCTWGTGVFRIDPAGQIKNFRITGNNEKDTIGNYTISLLEVEKDLFWIGSYDGIYELNAKTGRTRKLFTDEDWVNPLEMVKIGNFILFEASPDDGLCVYNRETRQLDKYTADPEDTLGLQSDYVLSIDILEKSGEILISYPGGLSNVTLDQNKGALKFIPLPKPISDNLDIIYNGTSSVYQVLESSEGILWFCTWNGLVKIDPLTGETGRWTKSDGLSSSVVRYMEEDNHGNLWLGTKHGLSMLDPDRGIVRSFDESGGFPGVSHALGHNCYKNDKGIIYFSGTGDFYSINPEFLHRNDHIPPVVITDIIITSRGRGADRDWDMMTRENITYADSINLDYSQNNFSLRFAALDFNDPARNMYKYRLEGFQENWINTDHSNPTATYTNLDPGEYIFRVKASNNDGIWNEEGASLLITIDPPWYRTILAYIVYFLLLIAAVYGYLRWRTWALRKEKEILEQEVIQRTATIEKQKDEILAANRNILNVNTQLEEQKEELEQQTEELTQQKEELQITLDRLKETQEQLIQSEKLAALGGLVAGVAHEINTPVGISVTAASNLAEETKAMAEKYKSNKISKADFKEYLTTANQSAKLILANMERTAEMVQSFKMVSADQATGEKRRVVLRSYMEDIIRSLYPRLKGRKISINLDIDPNLELETYPGAISQIFTNLILNSLVHGYRQEEKGDIEIQADIRDSMLNVSYADSGAGIPEGVQKKIFEPFFTTNKKVGTGLGLHIVYNLVTQKLEGRIECESKPGKGASFLINIPVKAD